MLLSFLQPLCVLPRLPLQQIRSPVTTMTTTVAATAVQLPPPSNHHHHVTTKALHRQHHPPVTTSIFSAISATKSRSSLPLPLLLLQLVTRILLLRLLIPATAPHPPMYLLLLLLLPVLRLAVLLLFLHFSFLLHFSAEILEFLKFPLQNPDRNPRNPLYPSGPQTIQRNHHVKVCCQKAHWSRRAAGHLEQEGPVGGMWKPGLMWQFPKMSCPHNTDCSILRFILS